MLFWLSAFSLAFILLITICNVLTAPRLSRKPTTTLKNFPKVSLLIPARNEQRTLERCIESALEIKYPHLEIVVLDDNSTDNTNNIIKQYNNNGRIRTLRGANLPTGWTGKNFACHQLAQAANGDVLIFTDADNTFAPHCVLNTVAWMEAHSLDMLSSIPEQRTTTFLNHLLVPTIDLLVYSFLLLRLTLYSRNSAFAAANGQWIAFKREAYEEFGGHERIRHHITEDLAFSRKLKRERKRILTTSGTGAIFGHMYTSNRDVWQGFAKNLYSIAGGTLFHVILWICMLFVPFILPYFLLFVPSYQSCVLLLICGNLFLRLLLFARYHHPLWHGLIFHPVSILFLIVLLIQSTVLNKSGTITWKDRTIKPEGTTR